MGCAMNKPRYNRVRKSNADMKALFRALVSAALLYMAWKMPSLARSDPTFPSALGWAACGLFAAAAVGFGVYTWKSYLADRKNAELTPQEEEALCREQEP